MVNDNNGKKWLDIVERVPTLVCNCPEEKYLTDKERVGEKSTWGRAALKRNIKRDRRGQTEKDEKKMRVRKDLMVGLCWEERKWLDWVERHEEASSQLLAAWAGFSSKNVWDAFSPKKQAVFSLWKQSLMLNSEGMLLDCRHLIKLDQNSLEGWKAENGVDLHFCFLVYSFLILSQAFLKYCSHIS